ncbi:TetR/AcrR family transcriptional regulator [Pelagibacterium halotolerans]|uniref:Transcriptional regulator, TetR family n=1 Tax=Pelagibacterium halotolerans (strain DSM 22347 / JCM 15775 / CGMCC 1.7692 / B2) TaxID=1082931 RepID=G4RFD9_PELHB|nr:TetR/AcrR family transcriptional regulator [Pelagibacterium halotolerans]AEQ51977.1 transcriptional regulator, TetR family [Pelagibacterium halotolerans B2]QJR18235.1 TetR/AcrR family transcriptional regulator [Pelagibacterium halotolerans]SDZ80803.1 transcriptional regulator, TetR family [Pelagibacterium halotolerans]
MTKLSSTAADILDCTRTLIMAGGYNGFSYADIAEVVGIRKASIHHHFPSKVDLVRSLVLHYREDARSGFAALEKSSPDPRRQLSQYLGYWQTCLSDGTAPICICALLASELPKLPPEIATEVRLHFETLSQWLCSALARGAEQGVFRLSNTPSKEAEVFMATVHGGMLSARVSGDPKLFGMIATALLDHLSR